MKKIRVGLIVCATIIVIGQMLRLAFGGLESHEKTSVYLGITGLLFLIIAMLIGIRNEVKKTDSPD